MNKTVRKPRHNKKDDIARGKVIETYRLTGKNKDEYDKAVLSFYTEYREQAEKTALKYWSKAKAYLNGYSREDCISESHAILLDVIINRYDTSKNCLLSTPLHWWIMKGMQTTINKYRMLKISTGDMELWQKITTLREEYIEQSGETDNFGKMDYWVAEQLNIEPYKVFNLSQAINNVISLDTPVDGYDDETTSVIDCIEANDDGFDSPLVMTVFDLLDDMECDIINSIYRLNDDALLEDEVLEKYGLDKRQFKRLNRNICKKLKEMLTDMRGVE